jgi:hypothetical protein
MTAGRSNDRPIKSLERFSKREEIRPQLLDTLRILTVD